MHNLEMLTVTRDKNVGSLKSDFDTICKHKGSLTSFSYFWTRNNRVRVITPQNVTSARNVTTFDANCNNFLTRNVRTF